ncbi:putative AC9 transposase [Bienertia sinuspersici]
MTFANTYYLFEDIEESHNGYNIKNLTINWCKNFHFLDNIFSLSLDNATAKTKVIVLLEEDPTLSLLLNGLLFHIRCCAHILNLSVQKELYNESYWDTNSLINNKRWVFAMVTRDVLTIFDNAINIFSFVYEPNIHQVILDHSAKSIILARIANDILIIPTLTIASEAAFSASRRVLDEKRSYLAPQSIEMCVYKND